MSWRRYKMNAKTFNIVKGIIQGMNFQFAAVTGACIDLAYCDAAGKMPVYLPFDLDPQLLKFIIFWSLEWLSDDTGGQDFFKKP
jgi:hypothetical protein